MSQSPTAPEYIEIPQWVKVFAILICVLGAITGITAIFVQIDPSQTVAWAGRTIGLSIVTGMAVYFKNPTLYMGAFAGGIARDFSDFIAEISKADSNTGLMLAAIVFILLGIGGIMSANVSRKTEKYKTD